jgi:hypothetical protein
MAKGEGFPKQKLAGSLVWVVTLILISSGLV